MPHSDGELKKAGTDLGVYHNHMRDIEGVELAEFGGTSEHENIIEAEFYFPGFRKNQIFPRLEGSILEINARRKDKGGKVRRSYFCLQLPEHVERDNVDIRCSDGLVEVFMPKDERYVLT